MRNNSIKKAWRSLQLMDKGVAHFCVFALFVYGIEPQQK
ncbi:hypothetical protein EPYR_03354 [Erwinia pyrifoliae DSM 12163]|nr:hypothetical protein EPYR_03354 [Erwinia pyrifoliae DSM 12163]